jgi:pSer/pThr/pTyr-binding forkhead associated (FHA) protein
MGDEISKPKSAVQHYTAAEIATLWKVSDDTIRKLFRNEPDVLVIGNQKPRYGRRRYCSLRIPEFVVERVHRRLSVP